MLATARIAGIMAAKRTPDLIPLCHPLALSFVAEALRELGAYVIEADELGHQVIGPGGEARAQVLAELTAQQHTQSVAPQRRLLTAAQAGEYMGKTEVAIRMMTYKRTLPCIRDGRSVRYDIRDLDARIDDLRV